MPCSIHQGKTRTPCKFCDEDGCLRSLDATYGDDDGGGEEAWWKDVLLKAKDAALHELYLTKMFVRMLAGTFVDRIDLMYDKSTFMSKQMKSYLEELEKVGMGTSLNALAVKLLLIHSVMNDMFNRQLGEGCCKKMPSAWVSGCVEASKKTSSYAAAKVLLRIREYAVLTRWPLKLKKLWAVLNSVLKKLSIHEVRWTGSMWPHHEKVTGSVSHECQVDETLYPDFFMSRSGRYLPVPSLKHREDFELRPPSDDDDDATSSANRMAALLLFAKEVTRCGAHRATRDPPPEWVIDFLACKEAIHMSMASPLLYGWDLSIVVQFRAWDSFGYNSTMRLSKFVLSEKRPEEEELLSKSQPVAQPACLVYGLFREGGPNGEKFKCKRSTVMRFLLQYREVEEKDEREEENPSKKPRRWSRSQPPPRVAGSRERIPALTAEEKEALKRRCLAMAGGVTARGAGIAVGQRSECVAFEVS